MSVNFAYADRLGIGQKKVDHNFECTFEGEMLEKAGFTKELVEKIKKKISAKKYLGFKKFELPNNERLLLNIFYDSVKKKYIFPSSVVLKSKNKDTTEYFSYSYGAGNIFEYKSYFLKKDEIFLLQKHYKVDSVNAKKFDKLLKEMNVLPDNEFVIKLDELTKQYKNFVKSEYNNHHSFIPYICKVS